MRGLSALKPHLQGGMAYAKRVPFPASFIWLLAVALSLGWGIIVLGIAVAISETSSTWWLVLVFGAIPAVTVAFSVDRLIRHLDDRGPQRAPEMHTASHGPTFLDAMPGAPDAPPLPDVRQAPYNGNGRAALVDDLTDREREVLALLSTGRTNGEIAGELFVANGTVKSHVNSICRKLGARNRTEAVARAREFGLVA